MNMPSDLKRSFNQFKKHEEIGHLKLGVFSKFFLSIIFFILLPIFFINIFFHKNKNKNKNVYILEYNSKQPYGTIYKSLKEVNKFIFIRFKRLYIPILPLVYIKDLLDILRSNPMFLLRNLAFFGALSLKISKYYSLIKLNNISNLIVLQEYSFYMSYLTRVMENDDGNLYNIMHGVPGETYCYFRFTKCFIWGKYFKDKYLKYGAEKEQFVISGSIFHNYILKHPLNYSSDIDILYTMDGNVKGYMDVIEVLEKLSKKYVVRIKQHPRQKMLINSSLVETDDDIITAIQSSKIIVGHFTTALLDSIVLNKKVVSYLGQIESKHIYVDYLDRSQICYDKNELLYNLDNLLNTDKGSINIDYKNCIDTEKNPLEVIINETC